MCEQKLKLNLPLSMDPRSSSTYLFRLFRCHLNLMCMCTKCIPRLVRNDISQTTRLKNVYRLFSKCVYTFTHFILLPLLRERIGL
jgi:hypothetical protein